MSTILVVDDEAGMRRMLSVVLERDQHEVICVDGKEAALAALQEHDDVAVMLTDLRMADPDDGLHLLESARKHHPETFVIIMTAFAEWDTAVKAMRMGAFNFLNKPFDNDMARTLVRRALAAREHYLAAADQGEPNPGVHMIGVSDAIRNVQELVDQVSTTDATVLVTGPSGCGKELVSRALHYGSLRADGPLVRVNAGALSTSLLESELFGHVKGAFTGAIDDRPGLFSLADGGTIFLDEVGDLPLETQVKLLRVLENREFIPVGGREIQVCNVRVVAATNKNLKMMVDAGTFREDLFYRLAVITIELPPLSDRREDIPLVAGHLLARHAVRLRRGITGFSQDAMHALESYAWPGNVRELDNRIQRGVALTNGDIIELDSLFGDIANTRTGMWRAIEQDNQIVNPASAAFPHSTASEALEPLHPTTSRTKRRASARHDSLDENPGTAREARSLAGHLRGGGTINLPEEAERFERGLILAAMQQTDNNLTEAAKLLGLSFRQIRYKAKQLGLR